MNWKYCRLYREENCDGTNSGVKWSTPNIHDLMKILMKVKVDLILDNVVDKRLSKVENLSVVQLRERMWTFKFGQKRKEGNEIIICDL